ncbi:MAG: DNA polymerase III subunit gamma/tau [Ignavibacteria bacterium]
MPKEFEYKEEEQYRVTARKWRPRVFSDVSSQEFITTTLKNSIKSNRISHAYLFCGPRGVGKTTVARILAKSLNCQNPHEDGDPCNECESCKEIDNDNRNHPDVFEIDGASNRNIEDVRELKEKVKYGPIRSRYKIFIIDEVHMLTGPSFNALLKTLEEPPEYVVFIFATTAPEKVPLTILGRCQKFDFKRLTIDEIITRIKMIAVSEKIKIDDESLFFIAKKGDGSMRDAQGLFDMSSAYCDNNITFEKLKAFFNLAESDVYFNITDLVKSKDFRGILQYFNELLNKGYDMQSFLDGLTEHYRNLLIAVSTNSADLIIESEPVKQKYEAYINKFTQIEIINSLKLILQTEYVFKYSSNQRTLIEALLIELIKFTDTRDISAILEELKLLKEEMGKNKNRDLLTSNITRDHSAPSFKETPSENIYHNESINIKDKPSGPGTPTTDIQKDYSSRIITGENPNINITAEVNDLPSHWTTIMDQIKTESKWVSSLLKDSLCESDEKGNYYITVNDSKYEILCSHKDYVRGKMSTYFGEPTNLRFVKFSESHPEKRQQTDIVEEGDKTNVKAKDKDNFDKICSILIENFNGKEIKP